MERKNEKINLLELLQQRTSRARTPAYGDRPRTRFGRRAGNKCDARLGSEFLASGWALGLASKLHGDVRPRLAPDRSAAVPCCSRAPASCAHLNHPCMRRTGVPSPGASTTATYVHAPSHHTRVVTARSGHHRRRSPINLSPPASSRVK